MQEKKNHWLSQIGRQVAKQVLNLTGNKKDYVLVKSGYVGKKIDYSALWDGETFSAVAGEILSQGRTLMSLQRLHVLWQAVGNTVDVPGDVAEVGVFRGGSTYFLARACSKLGAKHLALHAIDTFEGHASGTITSADSYHKEGMFADTSYEAVCEYLAEFDFVCVHKGEFSAVSPNLRSSHYRLVHIDTDLFKPTLNCLNYFLPRLSPGGILLIDDYLGRKCPGVTSAVHEFLAAHPFFDIWFCQTEQIVLVLRDVKRA